MNSNEKKQATPELEDCRRIWEHAPHNAFTDLIFFRKRWYCTFREADCHAGGEDGRIRVIRSRDGREWKSAAVIEQDGVDLRDPKFSVTPGGRLMLLMGGSIYRGGRCERHRTRVSFSTDGANWTPTQPVLEEGDWLWRLTWDDNGHGYGFSRKSVNSDDIGLRLYVTEDGLTYRTVIDCDVDGRPNETTARFLPDGRMIALVRRESASCKAFIGVSSPPFTDWSWRETDHRIGGPNFIQTPDGVLWAGGRDYSEKPTTVLARMTTTGYEPLLTLPSGGDNSYPGMVFYRNRLWFSYYSSHEGQTSIYLARIALPQ